MNLHIIIDHLISEVYFMHFVLLFCILMVLVDSVLARSDASPWVMTVRTIFACFSVYCGAHFALCSIKGWPFIIERGQLRIFLPCPLGSRTKFSFFFLWKTAVILIDEIQRCPKQSGGSPTVAHRRGAPVLSLFGRKKKERVRRTPGGKETKSRFSVQKGQKSSISLQAVGKWKKTFSTCRRKQYLLGFFFFFTPSP